MTEFTIDDGWMSESSVRELAAWYHDHCPLTDQLTFETHLTVLRAYATLVTESPLETEMGISRARYNILRLLYQAPDNRLLMGDIVQGMNVSPTNITKLVDTLVGDGLVHRVVHDVDKRKTWAELTPEGIAVIESALPSVANHVRGLWDGLNDEEKRILVHLLSKARLSSISTHANEPAKVMRELAPLRPGIG
ncbi:MAG TPA: MarR family transcriptional regulator [Dehalococcoidia bacterium]|nr:MarR family transcriptional regulator [Dehalococcoidia bacterium]